MSPQYLIGRHPRRGWRPDYSGVRFFAVQSWQGSTRPGVIAGGAPGIWLGSLRIYASSSYVGKAYDSTRPDLSSGPVTNV